VGNWLTAWRRWQLHRAGSGGLPEGPTCTMGTRRPNRLVSSVTRHVGPGIGSDRSLDALSAADLRLWSPRVLRFEGVYTVAMRP
jgi:hypothetical protein